MAGGSLFQLRCLSAICRLLRGSGNCIRTSPSAYYRLFSKHTRLCLRYANKPRMITISAALMRYAKRLSAPVTNCILGTPSLKNWKILVVLKRLSTAWSGRSKRKHARSTTVETKATGCSPASGIYSAQMHLRVPKKAMTPTSPSLSSACLELAPRSQSSCCPVTLKSSLPVSCSSSRYRSNVPWHRRQLIYLILKQLPHRLLRISPISE